MVGWSDREAPAGTSTSSAADIAIMPSTPKAASTHSWETPRRRAAGSPVLQPCGQAGAGRRQTQAALVAGQAALLCSGGVALHPTPAASHSRSHPIKSSRLAGRQLTACLEVGVAGSEEDHLRERRRHWELQGGSGEKGRQRQGATGWQRAQLRPGFFSTIHPQARHQEADQEGGRHLQSVLVALRSAGSVHSAATWQLLVSNARMMMQGREVSRVCARWQKRNTAPSNLEH